MIIKRIGVVFLFLLSATLMNAQSVEEVLKIFPGENAAMLNQVRDTKIYLKNNQPVAESREEAEIIILNDKAIGIYNKYKIFHGSFNELKEVEAFTRVPDGTKFKTVKVANMKTQQSRSNGVFYDDTKETIFDFHSIITGAIANVKHTEFHKDVHLLSPFYLSSYMPVVNTKFTVSFPSDMVVNYILKNNLNNSIKVKETKKGKQTVYDFTATNIKSRTSFSNAPSAPYYEPHVIIQIVSYKDEDGKQVNFLGSVDDLYKWNAAFLKDINTKPSPVLKHLADSLTANIFLEKEKARAIYSWVQDHIKYVAFEEGLEGFIPRQAADVCAKRYGDCKDMSSLLTELLKLAGLKGYFTWIGTRLIPYDYNDVPLPITDNHMISTVNIGDEWIFLDGTDPNCIFGNPPKAIQGKQALVGFNANEYKIIRVPEIGMEKNYVSDSTIVSITDKGIKGSTTVHYNGYFGADALNSLLYYTGNDVRDYVKGRLVKGNNKFIMNTYEVNKISASDKTVNIKTSFEVPDYGKTIGDEMYINLNLDRTYNSSLLDTSKRRVGVDNEFRFQVKNYTELTVPEGFAISSIPANHAYKNEFYGFSIKYKEHAGKVSSSFEFNSDIMILLPKDFDKWNQVMKELGVQIKKQLVLKKL